MLVFLLVYIAFERSKGAAYREILTRNGSDLGYHRDVAGRLPAYGISFYALCRCLGIPRPRNDSGPFWRRGDIDKRQAHQLGHGFARGG